MTNRVIFKTTYQRNLLISVQENPNLYAYDVDRVPTVVERMMYAIDRGEFHCTGLALRTTCRELKIKPTVKAIQEYVNA